MTRAQDAMTEGSGAEAQTSRKEAAATIAALREQAERLTHEAEEISRKVAGKMRRPLVAATVVGVTVLAAGAAWGASEAAIAAFAAYAVFRMLKRDRSGEDTKRVEHASTDGGRAQHS